jgi:uncharacterized protein (TIGR02246 family)
VQRVIQTQPCAQALHVLRRRRVAEHRLRRIAGHEVDEGEDERRHPNQDGDREQQAAHQVAEHGQAGYYCRSSVAAGTFGDLVTYMGSDDRKQIQELDGLRRQLEAAENAGNAEYICSVFAADAVLMVPNEPVQEGRDACARFIRDLLPSLLEYFERHVSYISAEVRLIGDFAFDRGEFSFSATPRSGGDTTEAHGKYLWLYSRSAEGSWQLARAIMSLDDPPENC